MNKTDTAQESLGYLSKRTPNKLLYKDGSPSAGTYTFTYELSQRDLAVSLSATLGASSSISVNVYPVDPAGNVMSTDLLQLSLSASGNTYVTAEAFSFRQMSVSVVVTGSVSAVDLAIYG